MESRTTQDISRYLLSNVRGWGRFAILKWQFHWKEKKILRSNKIKNHRSSPDEQNNIGRYAVIVEGSSFSLLSFFLSLSFCFYLTPCTGQTIGCVAIAKMICDDVIVRQHQTDALINVLPRRTAHLLNVIRFTAASSLLPAFSLTREIGR